jgi:bifunctional DNA-binding transcriptional regulator/antitoxin component of YhaV-PrlF toxin-antitoxin module
MIGKTLSIGARGQITLPKKLRDLFKTNAVVLELVDDTHAMISPVPDVVSLARHNDPPFGQQEWPTYTNLFFSFCHPPL